MSVESQENTPSPPTSLLEDLLEAEQETNIGINPSLTVQSGIASYYTAAQAILVQGNPHLWIYSIGLRVQSRNLLSALKVFNETVGTRTDSVVKGTAVLHCEGGDEHELTTVHMMLESKMAELLTIIELLENHRGMITCEVNTACGGEDPQQTYFFDGDFSIDHPFVGNGDGNTADDEHEGVDSICNNWNRDIRRELFTFDLWKRHQRDIPTPAQLQRIADENAALRASLF
eukprot:CAMPEP_0118643934 /NCGR_PEP_ID=MMETSP0785-20121206/6659_1 /TAXON_ID=91992 /ORGANISM="Bolidomonas pacifica, Strain CCMP 1866" /LENGTH=230 /DNA_ID=CAMNT_0006535637 /DNA_START=110 /DNA_END=802 /DNA_ORIENTATION=-